MRWWGSSRHRRSGPGGPPSSAASLPTSRARWAAVPCRPSSRRRSWSGCGCSTRCCGWSSGPRRGVRCCSSPRTCTGPTGRAWPCAPTSAGGSRRCRCSSCSPAATARPARTPTRCSPTSPGGGSTSPRSSRARCGGPRWRRSSAASRRCRMPWSRRWSWRRTATRCSPSRAPGPWPPGAARRRRACEPSCGPRSARFPSRRGRWPKPIAAAGRGLAAAEVAALPATDEAERRVLDTGLARRAGGGLAYRHALLAEAARADLRDPEGTHLAVALAVEAAAEGGDARAAEVARHLQWAGRDDLAAPRWRRAARHARSLGALPEAAAFWTEALRCDPDDPTASARARRGARLVRTDPGLRAGVGDGPGPARSRRPAPRPGAAAGCSSGPSPATRPSPSPPTAGPRSCSPGTRPPRCGPRC